MTSTDDTCLSMAHSKAKHKLALALLQAGEPAAKVSEQLGISLRTVQRWRSEAPGLRSQAPEESGELSPALTLASIAIDGKMPAGARVTAAKALLDMAPVSVANESMQPEATEFERFEVSIMAGCCYAELLLQGRHSLTEAQVEELESLLDDLRGVLVRCDAQRGRTKKPPVSDVISTDETRHGSNGPAIMLDAVRVDERGASNP